MSEVKKDYYKILNLTEADKNLPWDEFEKVLKKNYRNLCIQYHPDKQAGKSDAEKAEAENMFKDINEANAVLSDKEKRQQYDMFGSAGGSNMGGFPNDDLANLFRNMHSGFGFGDMFGGRHQQQQTRVVKGNDCRIRINFTLEDIYNNVSKTIKYKRQVLCSQCNGTGSSDGKVTTCPHCQGTGLIIERQQYGPNMWAQSQTVCPHCHGSGQTVSTPCNHCHGTGLEETSEEVKIPAPLNGTVNPSFIMNGLGNMAPSMPNTVSQPGNLIIQFVLTQHPVFSIAANGLDVCCKTSVNVLDCILGCEKEIKTVDGKKIKIKIPQGCVENDKVVVPNYGLLQNNGKRANMLVYIHQVMPTTLSSDDKKKIEELKKSKNFQTK